MLQVAFDWYNSHLHEFVSGYGPDERRFSPHECMVEASRDPNDPDYSQAQEWMEWAYGEVRSDPAAFDVKAMDEKLRSIFSPA